MRLVTENFVPFAARIALGFFLALIFAGVGYVVAFAILVSFWELTPLTVEVAAISAIGTGAGVGGSLGWVDLDAPRSRILLGVMLAVLAAVGGAWVGLQYGRTVYFPAGMPGIGELSGILKGAIIAGNLAPIVLGVIRAGWSRYRSIRLRTSRPDLQDGSRSSTAGRS
jgi:hypothetical protein